MRHTGAVTADDSDRPRTGRRPKAGSRPEEERRPRPRRPRRPRPTVAPWLTGIAAGLLVGLLSVALVALAMAGFEAVRGTSSGGGPGFLVLVAIVALAAVVGRFLLAFGGVPYPGMTSFLGLCAVLVMVLLFLMGEVFSVWMWLVIPVLAAIMFALFTLLLPRMEAGRTRV